MKVTELRVGNLASHNEEVLKIGIIDFGEFEHSNLLEELEPIPLSEIWLKNLGFDVERVYEGHTKKVVSLTCYIMGWYVTWEKFIIGKPLEYSMWTDSLKKKPELGTCIHSHLKYVHELQNIYFALTKKELIIKK